MGTVIVNRDHVDWIVEAVDEEVEMPEIPHSAYPKERLVKDFTGQVHFDQPWPPPWLAAAHG